jgi:hypothetical protein
MYGDPCTPQLGIKLLLLLLLLLLLVVVVVVVVVVFPIGLSGA